ncbi:MAG: serine/threonine-protein kinase [Acidimicrobiales bacterium]
MNDDLGAAPPPPRFAVLAGRYEVGEILGRGGMGEIRAGVDRRLGRQVAIKILRADMAHDPLIRGRFEQEGRMAARLAHPNVVSVFDTGEQDEVPFLVMERLSGATLANAIAGGPLDLAEIELMATQMLDALEAAHSAGMVHRDVKPSNVLAATAGGWKVGDFGIAKSLEVSTDTTTTAGLVIGTLAYLAPERLNGAPAGVATDLYAAGVVVYEALTGSRPVPDGAPLASLLAATPADLRRLRPDVNDGLAAMVEGAMHHDPALRFVSARDMAATIAPSRGRRSGPDRPDPRGPDPADDATVVLAPIVTGGDATVTRKVTVTEGAAVTAGAGATRAGAGSATRAGAGGPTRAGAGGPTRAGHSLPGPRQWLQSWADPRQRLWMGSAAVLVIVLIVIGALAASHHGSPPPLAPPSSTSTSNTLPSSLDSALTHLSQLVKP